MTKKKSEKTEEKKVSEETVAEETETENTEEPAKDENADKIKALEDELSAQKDKYNENSAQVYNPGGRLFPCGMEREKDAPGAAGFARSGGLFFTSPRCCSASHSRSSLHSPPPYPSAVGAPRGLPTRCAA